MKYDSLARAFQKANIATLEDKYEIGCDDCMHITVSFIKNHQICKTVEDVEAQSPLEFIWAYLPLGILYQQIHLQQIRTFPCRLYAFVSSHNMIYYLKGSEAFYLQTELFKSKSVLQAFEKKYIIPCSINGWDRLIDIQLTTDGRYYQYQDNGKTVTLDLGYNFIERNKLEKRFVKRKTE